MEDDGRVQQAPEEVWGLGLNLVGASALAGVLAGAILRPLRRNAAALSFAIALSFAARALLRAAPPEGNDGAGEGPLGFSGLGFNAGFNAEGQVRQVLGQLAQDQMGTVGSPLNGPLNGPQKTLEQVTVSIRDKDERVQRIAAADDAITAFTAALVATTAILACLWRASDSRI